MPDFEDKDDRRERCGAAAMERRDVWMSSVVAMLESGLPPYEATGGADEVLRAFDEKFPGVVKAIDDWAKEIAEDDNTDE